MAQSLHDHTYGITSDPLTRFTVVLAGLLHDVDHPGKPNCALALWLVYILQKANNLYSVLMWQNAGVPNSQLVKENANMAQVYNNKSIAEQNSVDISW